MTALARKIVGVQSGKVPRPNYSSYMQPQSNCRAILSSSRRSQMRTRTYLIILTALLLLSSSALGQSKQKHEDLMGRLLQGQIQNIQKQVVDVANAMPADKFGFKPQQPGFSGVRTFAQQLKHL